MSSGTIPPDGLEGLRIGLRRWTDVVEACARGRSWSRQIDVEGFTRLRRDLVETSVALAEVLEPDRRVYLLGVADLVKPWVTPCALQRAQPEVLKELLVRCRQIEPALASGRRRLRWPTVPRSTLRAAALLLPAVAVLLLFHATFSSFWTDLETGFTMVRLFLLRVVGIHLLTIIAGSLIAISVLLVSWTARS